MGNLISLMIWSITALPPLALALVALKWPLFQSLSVCGGCVVFAFCLFAAGGPAMDVAYFETLAKGISASGGGSDEMDSEICAAFAEQLQGIDPATFHPTQNLDDAKTFRQALDPHHETEVKMKGGRSGLAVSIWNQWATGLAGGSDDQEAKIWVEAALRWFIAGHKDMEAVAAEPDPNA
jgi:hypothetical protein